MQKLKVMILMMLSISLLYGCSSNSSNEQPKDLTKMMELVYADLDMPNMQQTVVTKENAVYFLGIDNLDYEEALASEPMISSIAHSVVLINMKNGTDIEKAKADIKANIDGRKWICVEVAKEDIIVENKGNIIILIMDNEVSDRLLENFNNIS